MDRRSFLREAILLVGGTVALSGSLSGLGGCAPQAAQAALSDGVKTRITQIASLMFPATKTFGGADVDIASFFDELLSQWASKETRTSLLALLDDPKLKELAALDTGKAAAALTAFDAAAFQGDNKAWKQFKNLAMLGFFGSEKYQTEIGKFELVPGRFDPCVTLEAPAQ